MKSDLSIPKEIVVGYQNREDTYSGKLGYIVYKKGSKGEKGNFYLMILVLPLITANYKKERKKSHSLNWGNSDYCTFLLKISSIDQNIEHCMPCSGCSINNR
jgi:hypothetical protein